MAYIKHPEKKLIFAHLSVDCEGTDMSCSDHGMLVFSPFPFSIRQPFPKLKLFSTLSSNSPDQAPLTKTVILPKCLTLWIDLNQQNLNINRNVFLVFYLLHLNVVKLVSLGSGWLWGRLKESREVWFCRTSELINCVINVQSVTTPNSKNLQKVQWQYFKSGSKHITF